LIFEQSSASGSLEITRRQLKSRYLASGAAVEYGLLSHAAPNIRVVDDQQVVVNCGGRTTLAPGQSMTCTGSGTAVAGQYRNTGTVTASQTGGSAVSASDPSHYFGRAPEPDPPPTGQLTICHIPPGNYGARQTITIDASAWPAHRGHCA
jgi:hypothetical protein